MDQVGDVHVVVADHRDVVGDAEPALAQPFHEPQGELVVGAEDRLRPLAGAAREGRVHRALALVGIELGQVDDADRRVRVHVGLDEGVAQAFVASADLFDGEGAGHEGDPFVAETDEVAPGGQASRVVVHADTAPHLLRDVAAVQGDPSDPLLAEPQQVGQVVVDRHHHRARGPLLGQQPEVAVLPLRRLRGVEQDDRQAQFGGLVLHAAGHLGEEGVGHVQDQEPHGLAAAGAQVAPGGVAHVVELGDGGFDLGPGRLGDPLRTVEHVRHGPGGDPSVFGDLGDPRGASRWGGFGCRQRGLRCSVWVGCSVSVGSVRVSAALCAGADPRSGGRCLMLTPGLKRVNNAQCGGSVRRVAVLGRLTCPGSKRGPVSANSLPAS